MNTRLHRYVVHQKYMIHFELMVLSISSRLVESHTWVNLFCTHYAHRRTVSFLITLALNLSFNSVTGSKKCDVS